MYPQIDNYLLRYVPPEGLHKDKQYSELVSRKKKQDDLIAALAKKVFDNTESDELLKQPYNETAITILKAHIISVYSHQKYQEESLKNNGLPAEKFIKVKDYIHDNLDKDISLKILANIVHISPYHFARLFKQTAGVSPNQYVIQCRITKAKSLLKEAKLPVNDIGIAVGYDSTNHFRNIFSRATGTTPSKYRKRFI